jgi:hypothetical protein
MKLTFLISCSLLALTVCAQTKEAEFKKTEAILKRSNGLSVPDFKIVDIQFMEKRFQLEGLSEGKNVGLGGSPDWASFDYSIGKLKENEKVSKVTFTFDEEFDIKAYENKKEVDKMKTDKMHVYINSADAVELEKQLDELKTYTLKALNELRGFDQASLVRFLTTNLNEAVKDDDAKIKTISECEITFDYGDREIAIPTKIRELHSKEMISEEYFICYGKKGAAIKTKKNANAQTQTVEHPDIELIFEGMDNKNVQVEYALKRLASFCKQ